MRRVHVSEKVIDNLLVGILRAVNRWGEHEYECSTRRKHVPGDVLRVFQRDCVVDDVNGCAFRRLGELGPNVRSFPIYNSSGAD